MIVLFSMIIKKLLIIFIVSFIFFFSSSNLFATGANFSFYPDGGIIVDSSKGFTVDVLIDTSGEEVMSAKFVVLFDPTVLRLKKAERNSSLFESWPEDESSLDNDNGVVMLSGFTQSGTGTPFSTSDKPEIMARLTFEVLKEKTTYLDWEFDTNNGVFDTQIMKDGSPPQNVLTEKPKNAVFQFSEGGVIKPDVDTGIFDFKFLIVVGAVLLMFGGFMIFTRPGFYRRRKGTVVIIGDDK